MKLDIATVDKIAQLASLEFDKQEKKALLADLNEILAFVEKIDELDTNDVKPLTYITDEVNKLRPDESKQETSKEEALRNAPLNDSDYFKVPKVIERADDEENNA